MTPLALVFFAAAGVTADPQADVDAERAAWRFRRSVSVAPPEAGAAFAALSLPPEVATRCQSDLRDVRLVGPDGREVQFAIDQQVERVVVPVWTGQLVDTSKEKGVRSVWIVDLGEAREFDRVTLEVEARDFAKRARVEVSDDRQSWRVVRDDAGVFDRQWATRVHHTTIALPERATARYLRLTLDDRRGKPVNVSGVAVTAARRVPGTEWRRPVALQPAASERGVSRYGLDLPAGFPFETFELDADDPGFYRRVVLYETREVNGREQKTVLGEASLYRLRIEEELLRGESLELAAVRKPQGGALVLEVHDGDSPPLRRARGIVSSPATRLLLPAVPGPIVLYYGNDATRAPLYDLESLKWRLGLSRAFAPAALGAEVENPRFRRTPPLPFVPPRGAPLDVTRWKGVRRLAVGDREDLYTVTLAPEDLALLRRDQGDVRIADESGRQVPYILEPAASEARVPLPPQADPRASRQGGPSVTRLRLAAVAAATGKPLSLPYAALELTFLEDFFTRPARLLAPPVPGPRVTERVLYAGTLARAAEPSDRPPEGAKARPIVLPLAGEPEAELFLEITDGDNAPLTLLQAQGVVHVPRLAFKAAPGAYRLLLGNRDVEPARYDIASLRHEILSYSAIVLQAAAAEPNPSFRRLAADYFKEAPPTVLLWGTLLAAIVVLLLLTARILKQPPAPGPGGAPSP